jgi:hypothetical protein
MCQSTRTAEGEGQPQRWSAFHTPAFNTLQTAKEYHGAGPDHLINPVSRPPFSTTLAIRHAGAIIADQYYRIGSRDFPLHSGADAEDRRDCSLRWFLCEKPPE